MATYVVIGGGLGGARSVEELRELDGDARIVLIGGEPMLPYERPPLSKDYLLGEKQIADFTPLAGSWFADHQVEARLGTFAINLDADERIVHTSDGRSVRYDGLVLATGSRPRSVDLPGVSRPGVQTLRNLDDADLLKAFLDTGEPS
ncbi:FAD-dependent oxidoreductase [Tessaracoccus sp. HDW20]|uniref:FAD-dependent oxidoreductase n=1 Tax=Tessaracoccus coleopterorum TaxID=2714950 RepID=UPI0018D2B14D|nr:FAD-dependent oxidoreductase [Tessaracoccus coleopterorum]NHB84396.1 FAD-dependent oxidoreductase [Tessaracoccus coleopterorum]